MKAPVRLVHGFAIVFLAAALTACASGRAPDSAGGGEPAPRLMTASYEAGSLVSEEALCRPEIADRRAVLDENCINVIARPPGAGRQIHALGRETQESRDLCENVVLPSCRRRY